jgi:hypothetical protein
MVTSEHHQFTYQQVKRGGTGSSPAGYAHQKRQDLEV